MSLSTQLCFVVLLLASTAVLSQDEPEPHIHLTDLLDLKDRAISRLCETTAKLLKNILANCRQDTYCEKVRTMVDSLPSGCGIVNESFNESVRKLAYCVRHRDQTCVDGLVEDMRNKIDSFGAVGDVAAESVKNL